MTMLALFAVGFLMLFYFEELRGFSTLYSGLLLTPLALTIAALAPLSGTVADRLNSRWQAPLGLAVACTGRLHLSTLDQSSTISYVVLCLVVAGTGQALFTSPNAKTLFTSPNAKTVMDAATPAEQGIASGIHATGRNVGQGLSVAMAAVFSSWGGAVAGRALSAGRSTLPLEQVEALQQTFVSALHGAFVVCAALAAIGVVTALAHGR